MTEKVLLLNIDSKLPNLALKKVEMFHLRRGDEVQWDMPLALHNADKVYISCIFTKNKAKVDNYLGLRPDCMAGGTGYDLHTKLPPDVEAMKPHINIGFTTRGCIRRCPFCCVPAAEGNIRMADDIYQIWDYESKSITLLDNNILSLPAYFAIICSQLIKKRLSVDFNQGLDIRLVTPEIANWLAKLKFKKYIRFSLDDMITMPAFIWGMETMKSAGIKPSRIFVYFLIGYNTTLEQDLERLDVIRGYGASPFAMNYQVVNGVEPVVQRNGRELREFASWVNLPGGIYKRILFSEWLKVRGCLITKKTRE